MNSPAPQTLTIEEANKLVVEHHQWAEAIARSVARCWNMDWQLDGLDGAAMEALIFCARRFDPARGVPFKGYARKRIHEAATEAARKSKTWQRAVGSGTESDQQAREISAELFHIFPELRVGQLPVGDEGGNGEDIRGSIRQLLVGASIIAVKQGLATSAPDDMLDYKKMVGLIARMEPIHQLLLWKVYWEGLSMRSVAEEWEIDELNVIREHKVILGFLLKGFAKKQPPQPIKIRPGLKHHALKVKKKDPTGAFGRLLAGR